MKLTDGNKTAFCSFAFVKKLVFIICILILVKPVLPVFEYAFNYDYISKVLCVNKAKPEMKCNGKCHLMKELAKASEKENPVSSDKKNTHTETETLYFIPDNNFNFQLVSLQVYPQLNCHYSDLYSYLAVNCAFHPPSIVS